LEKTCCLCRSRNGKCTCHAFAYEDILRLFPLIFTPTINLAALIEFVKASTAITKNASENEYTSRYNLIILCYFWRLKPLHLIISWVKSSSILSKNWNMGLVIKRTSLKYHRSLAKGRWDYSNTIATSVKGGGVIGNSITNLLIILWRHL